MNERFIEGGRPKLNWDKQYPIERAIRQGIEAANERSEVIDHRTARLIAEQLGTPSSALQTFAETGEVPFEHDDGTGVRLPCAGSELMDLVPVRPDKQPWLEAMAAYVLNREDNPEALRGWQQLTASPETAKDLQPQIYVVPLDTQQAGHSLGVWIDADQPAEDMQKAIDALLATVPGGDAVAWDIFDATGFGSLDVCALVDDGDPEATLNVIARVGQGIAEHGAAFAAYVTAFGAGEAVCEQFARRYLGRWHHLTDYARHVADDLGWYEHLYLLPEWMRDFVTLDHAKLAAQIEPDVTVVPATSGMVYVFALE